MIQMKIWLLWTLLNASSALSRRKDMSALTSLRDTIEFASPDNPGSVSGEALTQPQKIAVLQLHNAFRSMVKPAASNMMKMNWDDDLEKIASEFAKKCIVAHNPDRHKLAKNYDWVGENIAWGTGACGDKDCGDVYEGVKRWFSESKSYNFPTGQCSGKCTLFTQMVWWESNKLGCGAKRCGDRTILVCNYAPGGNYVGQRPYKTGKPCAECPHWMACEDNLCVDKENDSENGNESNATTRVELPTQTPTTVSVPTTQSVEKQNEQDVPVPPANAHMLPAGWQEEPYRLTQVDSGITPFIWGMNGNHDLSVVQGNHLVSVDGSMHHVTAGQSGVWAVGLLGNIFLRKGVNPDNLKGTHWEKIPGNLRQIDSGPTGVVWGVNRYNRVFCRRGVTASNLQGTSWQRVEGEMKYISCGEYGCWAVNKLYKVFFRGGITDTKPIGQSWIDVPGELRMIESGPGGVTVGLNIQNELLVRTGVVAKKPEGEGWMNMKLKLAHASVGDRGLIGILPDGTVVMYSDLNSFISRMPTIPPTTVTPFEPPVMAKAQAPTVETVNVLPTSSEPSKAALNLVDSLAALTYKVEKTKSNGKEEKLHITPDMAAKILKLIEQKGDQFEDHHLQAAAKLFNGTNQSPEESDSRAGVDKVEEAKATSEINKVFNASQQTPHSALTSSESQQPQQPVVPPPAAAAVKPLQPQQPAMPHPTPHKAPTTLRRTPTPKTATMPKQNVEVEDSRPEQDANKVEAALPHPTIKVVTKAVQQKVLARKNHPHVPTSPRTAITHQQKHIVKAAQSGDDFLYPEPKLPVGPTPNALRTETHPNWVHSVPYTTPIENLFKARPTIATSQAEKVRLPASEDQMRLKFLKYNKGRNTAFVNAQKISILQTTRPPATLPIGLTRSCCAIPDSVCPIPRDCVGYIECHGYRSNYRHCEQGQFFNPVTNICDYPRNVDCGSYKGIESPSIQTVQAPAPSATQFVEASSNLMPATRNEAVQASVQPRVAAPHVEDDGVLREVWFGLGLSPLLTMLTNNPRFPTNPDEYIVLNKFEAPPNAGDGYGQRLSTYYKAPMTGEYTFYMACDNECELWISPDTEEIHSNLILELKHGHFTSVRQWHKYPEEQTSRPIYLQQGEFYFMESFMKEGSGGDDLSIGIKLPNGEADLPMTKNLYLVPGESGSLQLRKPGQPVQASSSSSSQASAQQPAQTNVAATSVQSPPETATVVQTPFETSAFEQPQSSLSSVQNEPGTLQNIPNTASVVQNTPESSATVQAPPESSATVQAPPETAAVVQTQNVPFNMDQMGPQPGETAEQWVARNNKQTETSSTIQNENPEVMTFANSPENIPGAEMYMNRPSGDSYKSRFSLKRNKIIHANFTTIK